MRGVEGIRGEGGSPIRGEAGGSESGLIVEELTKNKFV